MLWRTGRDVGAVNTKQGPRTRNNVVKVPTTWPNSPLQTGRTLSNPSAAEGISTNSVAQAP